MKVRSEYARSVERRSKANNMINRLKEKYIKEIAPKLAKEHSIANMMAVPKLVKVVVNTGTGDLTKNKEGYESVIRDLGLITGQKPAVRQAKISVASFNVRKGMPVGLKITLRGDKMYDFVDKLFSIVFPRLRDFRGISDKSFDKSGNYTLGVTEHSVFPEIDPGKVNTVRGLEITFVTSAKDPGISKELLTQLGMPFEK